MNELLDRPTLKKRPLKAFLCHAHADRRAVHDLYSRLKRDGVEAWLDKERLLPGQDWEREIRKAILKSDVVIVCLSRHFKGRKGYRRKELRMALERADLLPGGEIFIIPARFEKCDLPDALRGLQRVDLHHADGYEKLLRALLRRVVEV